MIKTKKKKAVLVWFPIELVAALDVAAQRMDSDRSKLIRIAARQKLEALQQTAPLEGAAK